MVYFTIWGNQTNSLNIRYFFFFFTLQQKEFTTKGSPIKYLHLFDGIELTSASQGWYKCVLMCDVLGVSNV